MIPNILFMCGGTSYSNYINYCHNENVPHICIDVIKPNIEYKTDLEIQLERMTESKYVSRHVNTSELRKRTHYFTFDKFYNAAHISNFLVKNKFLPTLIINGSDMKEDLVLEAKLSQIFNTDSRFCEDSLRFFSFKSEQRKIYDETGIPRISDVGENLCVKRDRKRPFIIDKITSEIKDNGSLCPKWRQEPLSYLYKEAKYKNEFIQKWVEFEYCYQLQITIDDGGKWYLDYVLKKFFKNGWFTTSIVPFKLNSRHYSQVNDMILKLSNRLRIRNRLIHIEVGKIFDDDTLYSHDFNSRISTLNLFKGSGYDTTLFENLLKKNKREKVAFQSKNAMYFWGTQKEFVDNNHVKNFTWYGDWGFPLFTEDD